MPKKKRKKPSPTSRVLVSVLLFLAAVGITARFSLRQERPEYPQPPQSVDVVVVGSGFTGLTAALSAAQNGADVFYLDLTGPAGGGFPAFSPAFWAASLASEEVVDGDIYTVEDMVEELRDSGGEALDLLRLRQLAAASAETLAWLEDMSGIPFTPLPEEKPGLRFPVRGEAQDFLPAALKERLVPLLVGLSRNKEPLRLLLSDSQITGITVRDPSGEESLIFCRAVILADGGFAASELLPVYTGVTGVVKRPEGGHTGTGLKLALAAGAAALDLDAVALLPVFLPEGRRFQPGLYSGAVLLTAAGERVDHGEELVEVLKNAGGRLFLVLGQAQQEEADANFTVVQDLPSLAAGFTVPPEKIAAALGDLAPPYRVAVVGLIALTPGGLTVDEHYRVLGEHGAIGGLYAAGEIASGILGRRIMADLVFAEEAISAKLAGRAAAEFARR